MNMREELRGLECICYGSNHPNCPYCKKRTELLNPLSVRSAAETAQENQHIYGDGQMDGGDSSNW
jgi:glutaredoxin